MIECNLDNCYFNRRNTHEPSLIVYGGYVASCKEWADILMVKPQSLWQKMIQVGIEDTFEQIMVDWGHDEI